MLINIIPILELIRLEEAKTGTLGILKIQKKVALFTLEPSDLLNRQGLSSIPAQQYTCKRHLSPSFGETFLITEVPNRTRVLFHWGNWTSDTEGCILLGTGIMEHKRGITNSRVAFRNFMSVMEGYDTIHLTIKEAY